MSKIKNLKTYKSGVVVLAGRPNVGKSSILNAFLGQKLMITSDKPQTTRNTLRGILTGPDYQIIWLDTPGLHRPQHELGNRMVTSAKSALTEADLILWVLDATTGLTAADLKVEATLREASPPVLAIWNKMDQIPARTSIPEVSGFPKVYFVSATSGAGLGKLLADVVAALPEGPQYYAPDLVTDHPERFIIAELIREQVLIATEAEVPHSVAVQVEAVKEQSAGPTVVEAVIYVERDSQKGIIIGAGGKRLKAIGKEARLNIEQLLDGPVFLSLWVKVRKNWRNDPAALKEFGYGKED